MLTKENLSKIKFNTKDVKLEKADETIRVALLPASLIQEAREKDEKGVEDSQFGLKILKAGVVDDKGNPVFETDSDFESLPIAIQQEIINAVFEYNGLTDTKELEKN